MAESMSFISCAPSGRTFLGFAFVVRLSIHLAMCLSSISSWMRCCGVNTGRCSFFILPGPFKAFTVPFAVTLVRAELSVASVGAGLFGSRRGNSTIIKLLVDLGANTAVEDMRGLTALGHAMRSNDLGTNQRAVDLLRSLASDHRTRMP